MKKICFVLSIILFCSCVTNHEKQYFVSPDGSDENPGNRSAPFRTISRAKEEVRKQLNEMNEGGVRVFLRAGTYNLEQPLVFNNQDFKKDVFVSYSSYRDEKVVLSAGREIEQWHVTESGLWSADINKKTNTQQLYVNGKRARRARYPDKEDQFPVLFLNKAEYDWVDNALTPDGLSVYVDPLSLKGLQKIEDAEIVIYKDWAVYRKQIERIDKNTGEIVLKPPFSKQKKRAYAHNTLTTEERVKGFSCFLTGHPSFINKPGEWGIDKNAGTILYKPYPDEKTGNTMAWMPLSERLIIVRGEKNNKVCNLFFSGIQFSHTAYELPRIGHDGAQAAMFYFDRSKVSPDEAILPEAMFFEYAVNCKILNSDFVHLGASGIRLGRGCRNMVIENNHFYDIGANCLMMGFKTDPASDTLDRVCENILRNNTIHDGGRHYPSGVGIWLGFANDNIISHNLIYNMPYTGISNGWKWNPLPSSAGGNKIIFNRIHDVMKQLGDGGGIYLLGNQPESEVIGNLIYDIKRSVFNHGSPNNGLYFDEGSKNYCAEKNIVYNVSHTPVRGHRSAGVSLENNVLIYSDSLAPLFLSPPYEQPIWVYHDTVVKWPKPEWLNKGEYDTVVTAFYMENNIFIKESQWSGSIEKYLNDFNLKPGIVNY